MGVSLASSTSLKACWPVMTACRERMCSDWCRKVVMCRDSTCCSIQCRYYGDCLICNADHLAEDVRDGDPDDGGEDCDGDAVRHAVEVSAGEVDDDVPPDHGEADQRVEQHEDEEHRGGGLQLRPQQHRVDVVPTVTVDNLLSISCLPTSCSTC